MSPQASQSATAGTHPAAVQWRHMVHSVEKLVCWSSWSSYFNNKKRSYEHGVCPMPSRFRYSLRDARFTRSCDVIDCVTNRFDIGQFLMVVHWNWYSISCRFKIIASKYIWLTILTFSGCLMLSVMWSLDSPYPISYSCPIVTKPLSPALFEILVPKDNWVTTLTFRGHVTSSVTWPLDSPYRIFYSPLWPSPYLQPFSRYLALKIIGSRPLPF